MSTVRLTVVSLRVARLALLALLALLAPRRASADICIDVHLRVERNVSTALVETMKEEAASIWKPYRVSFRWPPAPNAAGCAWTDASFDVLFGRRSSRSRRLSNGILGSTRLAVREIEHVPIYVDRDATAALLGTLSTGHIFRLVGRPSVGPADLGRALGRVLAHEVGHVLLGMPNHQARGLMRPTFFAADLLTTQRCAYTLVPAEVARLRHREQALNEIAFDQTRGCAVN